MPFRFTLAVVCFLPVVPQLSAQTASKEQERSAPPSEINERFTDPDLDPKVWVKRWESESREIFAARKDIVEALELAAGDGIADVGSGTGLFVELFSKAVTDQGRVYALDISPKFIEHIEKRVKEAGLTNVEAVLSREDSTELSEASADVVFLCDTYHHFEHPKEMLASIRRALCKGGRLIVVDFERIPGKSRVWVLNHVRAGKDKVKKEIERAGFHFDKEIKITGFHENYFLRFVKR